ncbi:MAG: alpha/beta hydrolase [Hyphomonas oceanitis]|uniref:alpha/beta fold hydrolase n=1 Tax=Hyphomonas oceanitis TaxID=81033 RepID=UPI0030019F7C
MTGDDIFYTSSDGLALHARSYGASNDGSAIVCLHGLTRNHKDFEPMIAGLGMSDRFISVDIRGRGQSERDPDPANYNPAIYAGDVLVLLDQLKLERVHLIGTSMGGIISMILMTMIPDRISSVVLNDVGPVVEQAGLRRIMASAAPSAGYGSWSAAAEAVARSQAVPYPRLTPEDWIAFARRTHREEDNGQVVPDFDPAIITPVPDKPPGLAARLGMWRLFAKMKTAPLLVIRGEQSDILSAKTADKMVKRHKRASLATIPGVGHAPLLNEPESLSAIRHFLGETAA